METLNKDLGKLVQVEAATAKTAKSFVNIGIAILFLAIVWIIANAFTTGLDNQAYIIAAGIIGGYMALNIGANDVANAIGPLAAIVDSASTGGIAGKKVGIPSWVLFVGAAGISMGLLLFGPKLIRTVGAQITRLNPMRAYCVALSAAITVIIATALGLPVSSTHIAVGAIFGVGFYREWQTSRNTHINHGRVKKEPKVEIEPPGDALSPEDKRKWRKLVRRQHLMTIVAAWLVTVPLAALLSAGIFIMMKNITL